MKYINICLFTIVIIVCTATSGQDKVEVNNDLTTSINSFFRSLVETDKIAGAVTMIVREGRTEHLEAYGYLDVENATPMKTNIIFPVGSITKVITSIAVLQLVETGKLQLDDPVDKYIPQFGGISVLIEPELLQTGVVKVKPSIRDLMRHTSGMVYSGGKTVTDQLYREAGFREWSGPLSLFIEKITAIPLAFQPGTVWNYSYSHDVLGYLIELVSGITLDNYFREYIFNPLGLKDTGFSVPEEKREQMTNLYNYHNKQLYPEDLRKNSIYCRMPGSLSGGGGWWSSYGGLLTTLSDFLIIGEMLLHYGNYDGKPLLGKKSIEELIKDQTGHLNEGNIHYGLGVGVKLSSGFPLQTETIYWAGAPYNAYFQINYKKKEIAVLFTNTAPFKHQKMMDSFISLIEEEN